MKRFLRHIAVSFCLIFSVWFLQAFEHIDENMTLSFVNLYPQSPMKNFVAMTMRLWSDVRVAYEDENEREYLLNASTIFAQEMLLLHSTLDMMLIDIAQKTHECPECMEQALHDLHSIAQILRSLSDRYILLTHDVVSEDVLTIHFILHVILMKVERTLQEQEVPKDFYQFMKVTYSSETTPLLVPIIT